MNVTVVDTGDIILALPEQFRIRVSFIVLSYASPVFKTLLGPNFREGQEPRSAEHPIEIALPDDDALAMKHLCHLLHTQTTDSDGALGEPFAKQLWRVVVLADKYDCVRAVSLPTEAILSRFLNRSAAGKVGVKTMAYLTVAAYLLNQPRYFYVFTNRLVLDYYKPFSTLLGDACDGALSTELALKLDEQRTSVRLMFSEDIPRLGYGRYCPDERCMAKTTGDQFAHNLARQFTSPGRWPPKLSTTSLREILLEVHNAGNVSAGPASSCHGLVPVISGDSMRRVVRRIYEAAGLCLRCTKGGGDVLSLCEHENDRLAAGRLLAD